MRRNANVDSNQREIVDAFKQIGYSVLLLHMVGRGCPDIAVGKDRKTWLVEIKDGKKVPSKRKLTDDERTFHALWRGSLEIIESVGDVIAFDLRNRP